MNAVLVPVARALQKRKRVIVQLFEPEREPERLGGSVSCSQLQILNRGLSGGSLGCNILPGSSSLLFHANQT